MGERAEGVFTCDSCGGLAAWLERSTPIWVSWVRIHVGVTSPVDAGLHPYPRHVARRQVCSCHTVSLDIGLSHPHTPGIIHDDAHTDCTSPVCVGVGLYNSQLVEYW